MQPHRYHRAASADGTGIVGGVYGQGPPLVLVHGSIADGESEWAQILPLLADHFTCYTPSTRGRGDSGHHPDVSREARVNDVLAFIDSLGEPVALAGVSAGGIIALGAAARTSAVTAVAVYEPVVIEAAGEEQLANIEQAVQAMSAAAARGRVHEAVHAFAATIANEQEQAALDADPDAVAEAGRYLEVDIEELRELTRTEAPSPTDPAGLRRIEAPVLLLQGDATPTDWFETGCRFVANHVGQVTVREVPGAGHLGQLMEPERIAPELTSFLAAVHQPA